MAHEHMHPGHTSCPQPQVQPLHFAGQSPQDNEEKGGVKLPVGHPEALRENIEKEVGLITDDFPCADKIGGKKHEIKDIKGWPITPGTAEEVQRAEMKAGKDVGKGSLTARVQSAAAYNVNMHVVKPDGTFPAAAEDTQ